MTEEKKMTGYPSIDKPWLKYYSKGIEDAPIPSKTMYRMIYDNNKDNLDSVAINYFDNKISYKTLFDKIKQLANAFFARGIKEGDVVTIISLNTPETIYCIYALNYIGATANLLPVTISNVELLSNIKETKSKIICVLDKILEKIGNIDADIPVIVLPICKSADGFTGFILKLTSKRFSQYETWEQLEKYKQREKAKEVNSEQLSAIIVYTSGTTGIPKGAVLTNNNLNAVAYMCSLTGKNYRYGEQFLNILPPFFSFGIGMLHLCLYTGMTEIPMLIPKNEKIIKSIKKYRPERFVMGPAFTDVIEKYSGSDLSFLIDLTGGGGAISAEKEKLLNNVLLSKKSKSKYLSGYGMTELGSAVSMNHNNIHKVQSVGIPIPHVNVKVVDVESGEELPYNNEGELLVSSPGLMSHYFNMLEETEKTIKIINNQRWIHTGDLAKIDEDGFIFITGRIKRIHIVTTDDGIAYKLFPQRMEEIIERLEMVDKCAVVVVDDEKRQGVPIVFVSTADRKNETNIKSQILLTIEKQLPEYYAPRDIVILDSMPITTSQKIDYRKLDQMAENSK